MAVAFPVPDILVDLDIPGDLFPVYKHLSAAEIRARLSIPHSKMKNLNALPVFAPPGNAKLPAEDLGLQLEFGKAAPRRFTQPRLSQLT